MSIEPFARSLRRIALAAAALLLASCAKPSAPPSPHPDAAALTGRWEQFIPVGGMPAELALDPSGSAVVDGASSRWRIQEGNLAVARSGGEDAYAYTVSGYMLTLYALGSETSCFYINPDAFGSAANGNAALTGQWAAWSGGGAMAFDGKSGLTDIEYTSAGDTKLDRTYAARDGILQTVDASGNFTYNLYSFSTEGALQLAETADYDNDVKQWTAYWKQADPSAGPAGEWVRVLGSAPDGGGLPARIRLDGSGGGAAGQGTSLQNISWEYYAGGFIVVKFSGTDRLYAWCDPQGGALYLGNPDVEECWYIDKGRFKPGTAPLDALKGRWALEDGSASLDISTGSLTARNGAGEPAVFKATAGDGLLMLSQGGRTYYAAYTLQDDSLSLYCWHLPVLGQLDMPIVLTRK